MALAQFAREYRTVRRAEGWGSSDGAYYRALPFVDLSARFPSIWRIRARSYQTFITRVLEPLERRQPPHEGDGRGVADNRLADDGDLGRDAGYRRGDDGDHRGAGGRGDEAEWRGYAGMRPGDGPGHDGDHRGAGGRGDEAGRRGYAGMRQGDGRGYDGDHRGDGGHGGDGGRGDAGDRRGDWGSRRHDGGGPVGIWTQEADAPGEAAEGSARARGYARAGGRRSLAVLDIGAGSGWLSYRLALRGHRAVAVDLLDDPLDGLGAKKHYASTFAPVLAEFDRLPLACGTFDLAIFNASLHYSTDYAATLREALRVLRRQGTLVILDSPTYRDPTSGARMVQERRQRFLAAYGFSSDALPSEHFLTLDRLDALASEVGLEWQVYAPGLDFRSALERAIGGLRARREPASFPVIVGRSKA